MPQMCVTVSTQERSGPGDWIKAHTPAHQRTGSGAMRNASAALRLANDEARRLFGDCILFRELGPDERNALFARVRIRTYSSGETIFEMGMPGDNMMAVLSGSVRISVPSPDGREIVLAILRPGEVFGEIALLDGKERTADASAMGPCHLAMLDRRDVLAFLERHPKAWTGLVEVLCGRLRNTDRQLAELTLLQLPTRLAKALLRFADTEKGTGRESLRVRLSQRELGNICAASRETVNKCLSLWQRGGIVHVEDGLVTIAKRAALEQLAELE